MLDQKWLRENLEEAKSRLSARGEEVPLDAFQELDVKRRNLLKDVEELKELRNRVSDEIGVLKKEGKDASAKIEGMREVGGRIKEMEKDLAVVEDELETVLLRIPNLPPSPFPSFTSALCINPPAI